MSERRISKDQEDGLIDTAVMWGPAYAGLLVLGPVGIFLGLVISIVYVCFFSSDDGSAPQCSDEDSKD